MDYDNTDRGVLFFEKKLKSKNHPDLTGKLNVKGKDMRIAAWEKQSKSGETFFSLAVSDLKEADKPSGYEQAKAKADEIKARQPVVAPATDDDDDEPINLDDIPF